MRSMCKTTAAVAASLLLAPSLVAADEVEDQLRLLTERLSQMEDRLQATEDELTTANEKVDQQTQKLEAAGLAEERSSLSALASFFERTEISGWAAASYAWNVNDPDSGVVAGAPGINIGTTNTTTGSHQFHPHHNSFQFDEFALSIGQAANDESRAGFQFDILFGETAQQTGTGNVGLGGGNGFWINQAYIEYASPIGVDVIAGKFSTVIGYETVGAPLNANITRGFTWGIQPVSHIGAMFSCGTCEDSGMHFKVGIANSYFETQPDTVAEKTILWSIGGGNDMGSLSLNGSWGFDSSAPFAIAGVPIFPAGNVFNDENLTLDLIAELTPSDAVTAWLNVTSRQFFDDNSGTDPYVVGLNVGSRVALSDRLGIAGRFEFLHGDTDSPAADINLYGVTGTIDYLLTDGLTFKFETTFEQANVDGGQAANFVFPDQAASSGFTNDDQVVLLAQLIYEF